MTTPYNENYNGTLPFSDTCYQINLATGVAQTITISGAPTIIYQALFSYTQDSNVYIRLNGTPVIPASGTTGTQQYSEFRPEMRYVKGGDTLNFISSDAATRMGVSLRKLQG